MATALIEEKKKAMTKHRFLRLEWSGGSDSSREAYMLGRVIGSRTVADLGVATPTKKTLLLPHQECIVVAASHVGLPRSGARGERERRRGGIVDVEEEQALPAMGPCKRERERGGVAGKRTSLV
jgi:hypothetical protein